MSDLWSAFAKMSVDARINMITQALNTHPDQAKNIYNAMTETLRKESILLNAIHTKYSITRKDQQIIDQVNIDKLNKRKPSKLKRQINLRYFEIEKLRQENISWVKIAGFLKQKHKIKISDRQLENLFTQFQKILNNTDGTNN